MATGLSSPAYRAVYAGRSLRPLSRRSFCRLSIQFALLVGIGGGIPTGSADIRLGDVVVARPTDKHGGVVQYDFGKATPTGFQRTGILNSPPRSLLQALSKLEANHLSHVGQFKSILSELERRLPGQGALVFSRPVMEDHCILQITIMLVLSPMDVKIVTSQGRLHGLSDAMTYQ